MSYGDQNCAQFGVDMRVDTVASWFEQKMALWENPACQSNGVCDPACPDLAIDPDCPRDCATNGVCAVENCPRADADCVVTGGYCNTQLACKSRLCVTDEQHPVTYCTQSCSNNTECGAGLECAQGTCRFIQKPVRTYLESCRVDDFCNNNNVCTGPINALTRCVKSCLTSADCQGATCEGGQGGQRYCRPAEVSFANAVSVQAISPIAGELSKGCRAAPGSLFLTLGALLLLRRRRVC